MAEQEFEHPEVFCFFLFQDSCLVACAGLLMVGNFQGIRSIEILSRSRMDTKMSLFGKN